MHSRLETTRKQAAQTIIAHTIDPGKIVELRRLQEEIEAIKQRAMFRFSQVSDLAWVDDWLPNPDR